MKTFKTSENNSKKINMLVSLKKIRWFECFAQFCQTGCVETHTLNTSYKVSLFWNYYYTIHDINSKILIYSWQRKFTFHFCLFHWKSNGNFSIENDKWRSFPFSFIWSTIIEQCSLHMFPCIKITTKWKLFALYKFSSNQLFSFVQNISCHVVITRKWILHSVA